MTARPSRSVSLSRPHRPVDGSTPFAPGGSAIADNRSRRPTAPKPSTDPRYYGILTYDTSVFTRGPDATTIEIINKKNTLFSKSDFFHRKNEFGAVCDLSRSPRAPRFSKVYTVLRVKRRTKTLAAGSNPAGIGPRLAAAPQSTVSATHSVPIILQRYRYGKQNKTGPVQCV